VSFEKPLRDEVERAAARIGGLIRETPVVRISGEALGVEGSLTLKLEQLQHSGSFKVRGASNRLLSVPGAPSGVVAASGGNHGAAVAYAARRLGYRAEIFVSEISSPAKVRFIEECGASVTVVGRSYAEAYEASAVRAEESGAVVVHAYDQPEVVAGQGTLGREIESQAPDLDTLLVAVGGAGLIGGIAGWYRGGTRVVGVEPEAAPSLHAALEAGEPVNVEVGGLAADSLGARRVGRIGFSVAQKFVERVALVDEASIREARRRLWQALRLVVEPGGAVALAALVSGSYRPEPGERVGVLLCGANTDPGQVDL
jgi:threonine dehydratase